MLKKQKNLYIRKRQTLESKINKITDILRRDDGISGAMMHTEKLNQIEKMVNFKGF